MRIMFLLYSIEAVDKINRKFVWVGYRLKHIFPGLGLDLERAGIKTSPEKYLTASFFSAIMYGIISFSFFYLLFFLRDAVITSDNTFTSVALGLFFLIIFFLLHVIYPGIIANKYAAGIDQSLMFALKSMLIQVTSGVSLFNAMVNVSKSNYGAVSNEFGDVVKEISSGHSETKALEKLALKTKSEYLKKTSWQLLTSLRSGASLQGALSTVVTSLNNQHIRAIKDYAAELNLWILLYLLLAAAIPTMGVTFLVIMSAMAGLNIGQEAIVIIIIGAALMQIALIGFVKTRIPKVYL